MEEFFLIKLEEDDYLSHLEYEEMAIEYCIDSLEIPEENIDDITITSEHLELLLKNIDKEDLGEDWYVNLCKISIN